MGPYILIEKYPHKTISLSWAEVRTSLEIQSEYRKEHMLQMLHAACWMLHASFWKCMGIIKIKLYCALYNMASKKLNGQLVRQYRLNMLPIVYNWINIWTHVVRHKSCITHHIITCTYITHNTAVSVYKQNLTGFYEVALWAPNINAISVLNVSSFGTSFFLIYHFWIQS